MKTLLLFLALFLSPLSTYRAKSEVSPARPVLVAQATASSQDQVLAVYPKAVCMRHAFDTKFKIFASPAEGTPLGYGATEQAAWDDAAAHIASPAS